MRRFLAGCGLLWLLYIACVHIFYRGATQSLTIDEALTFRLFIDQKARVLFTKYEANYHLLPTWFMWIGAHIFGKSEFILRLPSMFCGLVYLAGSWKLSRTLFPHGWQFLVSLVLLTSNPLLLDYLSAARGYGPALAFFTWAWIAALFNRHRTAGILLALSVLSNLTFLIPAACLSATWTLFSLRERTAIRPFFTRLLPAFALPSLPGLSIPLLYAHAGDLYFGADTAAVSISTLTVPSFAYWSLTPPEWLGSVDRLALPIVCLLLFAATILAAWHRAKDLTFAGTTFGLCLAAVASAHNWGGFAYPWSRTGLYLIWLFLVTVLASWAYARTSKITLVQIPSAILSILLAATFVPQASTAFYYDFRGDAPVRTFMSHLRRQPPHPGTCIGGSWRFDDPVNYYLLRYRIGWIEKMRRTLTPEAGCRFYILEPSHRSFVQDLNLTILLEDPVSSAVLAESKEPNATEKRPDEDPLVAQ